MVRRTAPASCAAPTRRCMPPSSWAAIRWVSPDFPARTRGQSLPILFPCRRSAPRPFAAQPVGKGNHLGHGHIQLLRNFLAQLDARQQRRQRGIFVQRDVVLARERQYFLRDMAGALGGDARRGLAVVVKRYGGACRRLWLIGHARSSSRELGAGGSSLRGGVPVWQCSVVGTSPACRNAPSSVVRGCWESAAGGSGFG